MEKFGTALTCDIGEPRLAEAMNTAKQMVEVKFPGTTTHPTNSYSFWFEPTTGMPVGMFTVMRTNPSADYWLWMSQGGNLAAVIRGKTDRRLFCFNVVWD